MKKKQFGGDKIAAGAGRERKPISSDFYVFDSAAI